MGLSPEVLEYSIFQLWPGTHGNGPASPSLLVLKRMEMPAPSLIFADADTG